MQSNSIQVRKLDLQIDKHMSSHWFDNNPILTHLVHALSFQFPSGEESFVKSVKEHLASLNSESLKKDARAFVAQEMIHSREHDALNNWVLERFPASKQILKTIEQRALRRYELGKYTPWLKNLAATVCLEHMTVLFANKLLADEQVMEKMPAAVKGLLVWHAIEEIEHKHVAWQVYEQVGGSYWARIFMYFLTSLTLFVQTSEICIRLIHCDTEANIKPSHIWQVFTMFLLPSRMNLTLLGKFFRFFSPKFRPINRKEDELARDWSKRLEELSQVRYLSKSS